jgi:pSer/pThr/pTyr-binding forkhead associated (FHA) protein
MAASDIPVLTFVSGAKPGEAFPLGPEGNSWVAGRSSDADLVLADDTVSRKHARIYSARGALWLRDLGSRNGTLVNGRSVAHHRLRPGDRITIGASLLRVDVVPLERVSRREKTQPPDEITAGRSMSGSIQDIPLADVLQWLATSRKTGTLRVRGNSVGELFLRQGRVYYARLQGSSNLRSEKALLRMMGWHEGTFELDSAVLEPPSGEELSVGLEHILMEAARVQDELAHLAERQKIPETAISLVVPARKRWRELGPEQLDLVQAIAEGHDWPTILDRLDADDVALTRTAIDLHKAGVIRY